MFAEGNVLQMTFGLSYFEQRRVSCVARSGKCDFTGKLSELRDHLTKCDKDQVRCHKCQQYILSLDLIEHCRQCSGEALQESTVISSADGSAGEKLTAMKNGHANIRDWESSKNVDNGAVINGANSVAAPTPSIARQLAGVQKKRRQEDDTILPVAKKVTYTPGPYRAASKVGAFIEPYVFVDAYGAYNSLTGDKKEHVQSHGTHISAGYAFELQFKCRKQEDGEVMVSFTLILCEGIWDALMQWPFSKRVTIILTHPQILEKDIRMLVSANTMVRRPVRGGVGKRGFKTEPLNWRDLERKEFIHNNNIYVNVELE
ncbi:hypothetical protein V5799_015383 [Amblyomma americanum]|uniref:TRAF1-6 MATH domain-containing protein n=1 Tax=Amblyomma americanum TaxID=6943 RepID=A0AAQ4E0B2_AMBAM